MTHSRVEAKVVLLIDSLLEKRQIKGPESMKTDFLLTSDFEFFLVLNLIHIDKKPSLCFKSSPKILFLQYLGPMKQIQD